MSSTAGAAGAAAAAAAARRAERLRKEEEDMTKYSGDDLEGWEFKIVRSATEKFKNYDEVKKVCDEEAQAGWEMVEKFDNSRIRFKRKIENRAGDSHRQIDPYRTSVGMSQGGVAAVILAVVFGVIGVVFLILWQAGAFN
jgi:hypothetical protein